ncbi:MAG: hypothetical protein HQL28_05975 [Candidatus Omnitrophica bacterium]|nr:hypothetical protein [Candidatus Omnitrophota bacterium]
MEIKTSPMHRQCKYPECKHILSIYNHDNYCHVHLNSNFWKDKVDGIPKFVAASPVESKRAKVTVASR